MKHPEIFRGSQASLKIKWKFIKVFIKARRVRNYKVQVGHIGILSTPAGILALQYCLSSWPRLMIRYALSGCQAIKRHWAFSA
jgi:hypothetical protein